MAPTLPEPKDTSLWQEVFRWLTSTSQGWELIGKWTLLSILALAVLLWAIGYLSEKISKLLDVYKKFGLPVSLDPKTKVHIRKRRQFCSVINADLSVLAKTENWNDQYFADLEAEVEAEGGYFPSALHKLFKRKSRGLRRVPSLIAAIESSAEQTLLLVGEPGSGKSVALRHLAHQLAYRGMNSSDPDAKIPLYVNLKELRSSSTSPNADSIKSFILDNIRRGDSDTVAYVRNNWEDFKFRGIWFFLFDSFDEIPAVLHAPTGSSVIRDHAEAIRQFLEGLGNCRGVLASREFKGPDSLPWQRLRILTLIASRQNLLIDNSFLEQEQKEMVRRHLAASGSALGANPMFLTLLCRYVKEVGRTPANDHDLLSGHMDLLSTRDSDYIGRKYGFAPDTLIQGAVQLAVLFGISPQLSLAPSQADISSAIESSGIEIKDLINLLAALVDIKILRSDVQEAKRGDQRFTFSHRRYQETLFVRFLAERPSFLSPNLLLTDSRWREYAVTLLQTQDQEVIEPLIEESCRLLASYETNQPRTEIVQVVGGGLGYFNWEGDASASLLSLLQEGLARRLAFVSPELSAQIDSLLSVRWEQGDIHDRAMVIKLGGLLSQPILKKYLLKAIDSSSEQMRSLAFLQSTFIMEMPQGIANWVRLRLSQSVLASESREDRLKLEALSARLPSSVGSSFVLRRCFILKRMIWPMMIIYIFPLYFSARLTGKIGFSKRSAQSSRMIRERLLQARYVLLSLVAFPLTIAVEFCYFGLKGLLAFSLLKKLSIFLSFLVVFDLFLLILYACRSEGQKITTGLLYKKMTIKALKGRATVSVLIALGLMTILFILMLRYPGAVIPSAATLYIALLIGFGSFYFLRDSKYKRRLRLFAKEGYTGLELMVRADSLEEMIAWLPTTTKAEVTLTTAEFRSFMRLLVEIAERDFRPALNYPLFQNALSAKSIDRALERLETRLTKSMAG